MTSELRVWLWCGALSGVGCVQVACSSQLPPPCDSATASEMAAQCAIQVQLECVDKGITEDDCEVVKECDKAAHDRTVSCGGGK